jgi:hypothetical protein
MRKIFVTSDSPARGTRFFPADNLCVYAISSATAQTIALVVHLPRQNPPARPAFSARCVTSRLSALYRARAEQADCEDAVIVKIVHSDKNPLPGKLAEAELHFTEGVLDGLKLIGFTIWERRSGNGRNVTFPARQYTVGGERRSFALLRPITGEPAAQERLRELILEAFAESEQKAAVAS